MLCIWIPYEYIRQCVLISSSFTQPADFDSDAKSRAEVVHYISVFLCLHTCLMDHSNAINAYINYRCFQVVSWRLWHHLYWSAQEFEGFKYIYGCINESNEHLPYNSNRGNEMKQCRLFFIWKHRWHYVSKQIWHTEKKLFYQLNTIEFESMLTYLKCCYASWVCTPSYQVFHTLTAFDAFNILYRSVQFPPFITAEPDIYSSGESEAF